ACIQKVIHDEALADDDVIQNLRVSVENVRVALCQIGGCEIDERSVNKLLSLGHDIFQRMRCAAAHSVDHVNISIVHVEGVVVADGNDLLTAELMVVDEVRKELGLRQALYPDA